MTEAEERCQRRVSELREQCTLEQQAKAHLEEALRTDIEERDELVKLLTMKVAGAVRPSPRFPVAAQSSTVHSCVCWGWGGGGVLSNGGGGWHGCCRAPVREVGGSVVCSRRVARGTQRQHVTCGGVVQPSVTNALGWEADG